MGLSAPPKPKLVSWTERASRWEQSARGMVASMRADKAVLGSAKTTAGSAVVKPAGGALAVWGKPLPLRGAPSQLADAAHRTRALSALAKLSGKAASKAAEEERTIGLRISSSISIFTSIQKIKHRERDVQ